MTYCEKNIGSRRMYDLGQRSLVISGRSWFGGAFRTEFALERIKPVPDEAMVKDELRTAYVGAPGATVTLISAVLGNALYSASPVLFYGLLFGGVAAMIFGFVVGGRLKACIFKNHDEAVVFAVTERGNSRTQFDAFVSALRSQIQSSRR